jgi:hypothetical protein
LVQDLYEGVKEVKVLGDNGEEASQKITELEALCKRLREDAQKLREEKTKLEEWSSLAMSSSWSSPTNMATTAVMRMRMMTMEGMLLHLLLLGITMFRGPKLLRTHRRLNGSAMLMEKEVTMPINAPILVLVVFRQLHLQLPPSVELFLFLLLPSKTMLVGESTKLPWRKTRSSRCCPWYFCSCAI